MKMQDRITTGAHSLRCPFCEVYELEPSGHASARCASCGAMLGGVLLATLRQITELPLAVGRHACECGHPEMRRLPDGVYRCPACGSEVTPVSRPS
jgi:ribosomal protein L37AE/L43A